MLFGSHDDKVGDYSSKWFSEKQQLPVVPPFSTITWLDNNNKILGVALFNDYTGSSIELHIHLITGLTLSKIKCIHNYVFEQLKCNILIAKPARKSTSLLKMLARSGFIFLAIIPRYYGNTKSNDAVLYYIDKQSAYRWK